MASPTRWTWVWVNSESWWWTGRPGVLWFMGSQRVRHDWATELNCFLDCFLWAFSYWKNYLWILRGLFYMVLEMNNRTKGALQFACSTSLLVFWTLASHLWRRRPQYIEWFRVYLQLVFFSGSNLALRVLSFDFSLVPL